MLALLTIEAPRIGRTIVHVQNRNFVEWDTGVQVGVGAHIVEVVLGVDFELILFIIIQIRNGDGAVNVDMV